MASLRQKIDNGLDESRILILGAQVLLGFQLRAVFEPGFDELSGAAQRVGLGALWLLLLTCAVVIAPAPFHRIVEGGQNSGVLHRFIRRVISGALLPLALAIGANLYLACSRFTGAPVAICVGAVTAALALMGWYGAELAVRARRRESHTMNPEEREQPDLIHRIRQVLTEARVVLPGAQALLGFQFITTMMRDFDKLPQSSKWIHLAAIGFTTLSTILLIAPAAYHRVVLGGDETPELERIASRLLLFALAALALGISGDVYVVTLKVLHHRGAAIVSAAAALLLCYGIWFGYTWARRTWRPLGRQGRLQPTTV